LGPDFGGLPIYPCMAEDCRSLLKITVFQEIARRHTWLRIKPCPLWRL